MSQVRILGIDIAKQMFHVVGLDDAGNIVWQKHLPRGALLSFMAQPPPL
jgi:hypothetical protein